ncbi:MAG: hypothetical protein HEP71_29585 [Roseivirga sp.]|nr:hypothetical protein [Roseivirga sp.]
MSQSLPPKWIIRLLTRMLDPYKLDGIYGDLLEEYNLKIEQSGRRRANWYFLIASIKMLGHKGLRRKYTPQGTRSRRPVLWYQLKLSTRYIRRNLLFSTVSALGTTFSLIGVILIGFYLSKEFSYDDFFSDQDQIYRVIPVYHNESNDRPMPGAPPALAPLLTGKNPAIAQVARFYISDINSTLGYEETTFVENRVFYADSSFLEILDFPLVSGNRSTALDEPNSVVLSKAYAVKYFGKADVAGELLRFNNDRLLRVTGVIEVPENSHLDIDILMSFSTFIIPFGYTDDMTSWRWNSFFTYVKLHKGSNREALEQFIAGVWESNQDRDRDISIRLQPVADIYLDSEEIYHPYFASHYRTGNLVVLKGLIGAVILILFIAGFNLMNLSSASLTRRGDNLNIARVLGSRPETLFSQFFLESQLLSLGGLALALATIQLFSVEFSTMIGYKIDLLQQGQASFIPLLFLLTVVYTLVPLIQPLLTLSRSSFGKTLVTNQKFGSAKSVVMIFQLVVTAVLLTTTLMVKDQLTYVAEKDLGFEQEQVLVAEVMGTELEEHYSLLRQQLLSNPHVNGVSRSKYALNGKSGGSPLKLETQDDSESFGVAVYESDYDFLEVMKIQLLSGRAFSREIKTDSAQGIILNKKAAILLGLNESNAVGSRVQLLDWEKTVIGVVDDFHYASLHGEVRPLAMVLPFTHTTKVLIKMNPGDLSETVVAIGETWKTALPQVPFDFRFLDSAIDQLYQQDRQFSQLISTFAIIAIAIALMGLYAVSGFLIQLRLKETAIRKVLGASFSSILRLLSERFFLQLMISVLISVPVSYVIASQWLQSFSYALAPSAALILIAILIIITLGTTTILWHSWRVAVLNPSKNLRAE